MHGNDAGRHGSRVTRSSRHLAVGVLGILTALPALAEPPGSGSPELFAPGIVSGPANDGSPTFTPDGQTLLFTRSGSGAGTILESHRVRKQWSAPEIASFSGQWNDGHPSMAPDGSYLVFVSTRPAPGVAGHVAHIWRVDRLRHGWGAPVHLPAEVNIGPRTFAPSVAADNTLYFLEVSGKHEMQLYRSRWSDGHYESAEALPFSTPANADVDPEIAPDQSFLIFASAGRRENDTREHLYVVFNQGGRWGEVKPLRYPGDDDNGWSADNEPNLAPDGQSLYFSSDRTMPLHLPRTLDQARADLSRIGAWDNGATNVWRFSIPDVLRQSKSVAP
jgi:Tol biopolymer transport system component